MAYVIPLIVVVCGCVRDHLSIDIVQCCRCIIENVERCIISYFVTVSNSLVKGFRNTLLNLFYYYYYCYIH